MPKDKKHDFCGGLLSMGTFMFLCTWLLAFISWIVRGEYPETLVQYVMIMQCVCFASYCCKAAYENVGKTKNGAMGGGP